MVRTAFIAFILTFCAASPGRAQLLEPTDKDQYVGVFLYKPDDAGWIGAFSSKATRELAPQFDLAWQFDYGSLGDKRITPTGKAPTKEADVSKNSGQVTLAYWTGKLDWSLPFGWRAGGSGGFEHKRTQANDTDEIDHTFAPLLSGDFVVFGNRILATKVMTIAGGQSQVTSQTLDWTVRSSLATASAVTAAGEKRHVFYDAKAEMWWSVWPVVPVAEGDKEPVPWTGLW